MKAMCAFLFVFECKLCRAYRAELLAVSSYVCVRVYVRTCVCIYLCFRKREREIACGLIEIQVQQGNKERYAFSNSLNREHLASKRYLVVILKVVCILGRLFSYNYVS